MFVFSMNYCFKITYSANESICQAPAGGLGILGLPPGKDLQHSKHGGQAMGKEAGEACSGLMISLSSFLYSSMRFWPSGPARVLQLLEYNKEPCQEGQSIIEVDQFIQIFSYIYIFALFNIRAGISMTAACCAFTVKTVCMVKASLKSFFFYISSPAATAIQSNFFNVPS